VHAWEDVGHYVMEDAPERVIEAMERFLGEAR
jgi:pimeloyl-ACP methyl ester carboxylesterase